MSKIIDILRIVVVTPILTLSATFIIGGLSLLLLVLLIALGGKSEDESDEQ